MGTPLKHALVDHPYPAWKVAQRLGVSDVRVSKLSSGLAAPRDWEKSGLAEILGKSEQELFPEPESPVTT